MFFAGRSAQGLATCAKTWRSVCATRAKTSRRWETLCAATWSVSRKIRAVPRKKRNPKKRKRAARKRPNRGPNRKPPEPNRAPLGRKAPEPNRAPNLALVAKAHSLTAGEPGGIHSRSFPSRCSCGSPTVLAGVGQGPTLARPSGRFVEAAKRSRSLLRDRVGAPRHTCLHRGCRRRAPSSRRRGRDSNPRWSLIPILA